MTILRSDLITNWISLHHTSYLILGAGGRGPLQPFPGGSHFAVITGGWQLDGSTATGRSAGPVASLGGGGCAARAGSGIEGRRILVRGEGRALKAGRGRVPLPGRRGRRGRAGGSAAATYGGVVANFGGRRRRSGGRRRGHHRDAGGARFGSGIVALVGGLVVEKGRAGLVRGGGGRTGGGIGCGGGRAATTTGGLVLDGMRTARIDLVGISIDGAAIGGIANGLRGEHLGPRRSIIIFGWWCVLEDFGRFVSASARAFLDVYFIALAGWIARRYDFFRGRDEISRGRSEALVFVMREEANPNNASNFPVSQGN